MAMQKRFKVEFKDVFPFGLWWKPAENGIEPVEDFDPEKRRADGSRPQAMDRETGLPLWQGVFIDADPTAGKNETALSIKFAAKVRPVPPENTAGLPLLPVELVGLTALPYVEFPGGKDRDGHDRTRIVWSFRAHDLVAPGEAPKSNSSTSSGPKAAA